MCSSHVKLSDQKFSRNVTPVKGPKAQSSFWLHLSLASFDYGQSWKNVSNPLFTSSSWDTVRYMTTLGRNIKKGIRKEN